MCRSAGAAISRALHVNRLASMATCHPFAPPTCSSTTRRPAWASAARGLDVVKPDLPRGSPAEHRETGTAHEHSLDLTACASIGFEQS